MNSYEQEIKYDILKSQETGSHDAQMNYKIVSYPFDRYEIKVKVSQNNEFLGIEEIEVNKEFLSYRQKISSKGMHDVEKFYSE